MTEREITKREGADLAPPTLDLRVAIEAAAALGTGGVEVLERLHALQRDERQAAAKRAFFRALAQARQAFPKIEKSRAGPHTTRVGTMTRGNYAPLEDIARAVDPVLAEHGISYYWDRDTMDGREYVVCVLVHEQGHEVRTRFPALVDEGRGRTSIQSVASGESYAKRYSLIAALGLTTVDPDDDGESAGRGITEEQQANLVALMEEVGADRQKMLTWLGVESIEAMTDAHLQRAIRALERKRGGS